jgi:hypothetical protein
VKRNPGKLIKIGGKQKKTDHHHNATHYNPKFFDTDNARVFPGTPTDIRQAGWLELMLIQFAYSLRIGVNGNRNSPNNMAALSGSPYTTSVVNPGCVYLVSVHDFFTTQAHFFEVHGG